MTTTKTYKLNNGRTIPALGLGTWQSPPGAVETAVYHALKVGVRHIDCAFAYANEGEVGKALKKAFDEGIVKREDIFVTSKLWCTWHRKVEQNLDESLKALGLDYLDLYLMHWPAPLNGNGNHPKFPTLPDGSRDLDKDWSFVDTYKLMETVLKTGKVKAIGVSNFSVKFLEKLLAETTVVPAINQIEIHPYLPQEDIVQFCQKNGIVVTAYSQFGSSGTPLMQNEQVVKIAKEHDVSPSTILLSYPLARGIVSIPKSVTPERIAANTKTIELTKDDVAALNSIHEKEGIQRLIKPNWGIDLGFPDWVI